MGVGQPWARYEDMFSGWASKTVADHLGLGSKTGTPYIHHNKASNPFMNLQKEYMGLKWQEETIRFFDRVHLPVYANTSTLAYLELSKMVKKELVHLNPYFDRLGDAMHYWTMFWIERQEGRLQASPSRSSKK